MTDASEPTAVRPSGALAAGRPALPVARTSAATDVALVATFAAFIAVCAILPAIPVAGLAVPITLQTFGVMLTGIVLGARRGALAVLLYVVVGLAGLPVFSGGAGGLAVVAKPSFGYIVGFVLAAALVGFLVSRFAARLRPARRYWAIVACATVTSLVAIHPLGIAVMGWRLDMSPGEAIAAGATFLPGDVVKNLFAALVATALFRAFPDLLRSRR
ncbi:biotin transporter BioY [Cellulomonas cellasea]|uniref:Biotin transporter n=2 Tax=Cellulomonas cellasea TaxID=43670 RepID=A0A0A0BCH7_9CELL|nr:biotin transporter BioY [Cellulomonas cellasea]KGM03036.1 biotin--protein ligase [Cellulomonas cellasea DSM 20118]GEA90200.1 biotin transporter BioY [Cellulomonas cellasea]